MEIIKVDEIKSFTMENCVISLWVFKATRNRAFSVPLSDNLMNEFKVIKNNCLKEGGLKSEVQHLVKQVR